MVDDGRALLDEAMGWLFRLRGVLDPAQAVPGLGASMSEALALDQLVAGDLTQQQLGVQLALEKSTVSRLVDAMAGKGWVDRAPDPDNRRYRRVRLTPAGRRAASQVAAAIQRRHDRVMAALTKEEQAALAVALGALARVIAEEFPGDPGRPPTPAARQAPD